MDGAEVELSFELWRGFGASGKCYDSITEISMDMIANITSPL